jgi:uncharacterized protein YqjF (DUF2071 family)
MRPSYPGRQVWRDLAFLHWPIAAGTLRPVVPRPFEIEEYDGTAWVAVTPFWISRVGLSFGPAMPVRIPEINVRTYVNRSGLSGVWFLSLDTTSALATWGARLIYHLPYWTAAMTVSEVAGEIDYESTRGYGARFRASYRPEGPIREAQPGTLEHWLTERYRLFAIDSEGHPCTAEIRHRPWPLQGASVNLAENGMLTANGLPDLGLPATVHFARKLDVDIGLPERIG